MKKIILATSVLIGAVFVVARLYFSSISVGNRNIENALSVIPNDASLIFEFTNDKGFYEIFSDYQLFDAIIGIQKQTELTYLKTALLNNKHFSKITEGQNIFLSFHPEKSDSISFLWTMPLPSKYTVNDFKNFIKRDKNLTSNTIYLDGQLVLEIRFKSLNKNFYLFTSNKIALGSFSKSLMQNSISNKTPKITKNFIKLINTGDLKNDTSPANIFINYTTMPIFLSSFFKPKSYKNFIQIDDLKGFSLLNMSYRSDALIFNGITTIDTSTASYLKIFLQQKPIKHTIDRTIPENTANFIEYGISSYPNFSIALKHLLTKRKEFEKLNLQLSLINQQTGINLERDVKNLWGNEFITFQLSTQEKLAAIKVSNGQKLQFFMEPISSVYSETIRRLDYPNLLYFYFGDPFRPFSKPYFTIIDNQLIVANSPGTVQRFINNYTAEKLLYKNSKFIEFNQLIADQSNVLLFVHLNNSRSNIKSNLKTTFFKSFNSDQFKLRNFYGISYQWLSNGNQFLTNFYAAYNQNIVDNKARFHSTDTLTDDN